MKKYIITTQRNLDVKLYSEWFDLWSIAGCANYVNGPQWLQSILKTFDYENFQIVCVRLDGKLVGISSLVEEKYFGVKVMTLPPSDFVSGVPFLAKTGFETEVFRLLTKNILARKTVVLGNIPENFVKVFLPKNTLFLSVIPQALNFSLKIDLDEKGEVIIPGKDKLLRETRKIQDKFKMLSYKGDNKEIRTTAFKIDLRSRKYDKSYNAFSDKKIRKFYTNLAINFKEYFVTNILYYDNTPIAYEMGFLINNTYTGSQIAYDKDYAKMTPGKVTEVKLINTIYQNGAKFIDYGSGENYIKKMICREGHQLYKVVSSSNPLIVLYLVYISSLKERMFHLLNRNIAIYSAYKKLCRIVFSNQ